MKLEDIEKAVAELPADELAEFRKWFHTFDAEQWDRQFEQNVAKGKLDHFAEEAIADYEADRNLAKEPGEVANFGKSL